MRLIGKISRFTVAACVIVASSGGPHRTEAQAPAGHPIAMLEGLEATKGEAVFRDKGCMDCHTVDGWGGLEGPDLGTNRIRGASPSSLAAAMWNQAPSMWRTIGTTQVPPLSKDDAAALYAFFYSRLYFNDLGDSPHGEDLFKGKGCAGCHDIRPGSGPAKSGPPVVAWGGIKDSIELVHRMWNHASTMYDRMARDARSWPRLTGQDATDLLVYLWRQPEVRPKSYTFRFGNGTAGKSVFDTKCLSCHALGRTQPGKLDLSAKLRNATIPQLAASMWNHAPAMKRSSPGTPLPALTENESRDLATYLVVMRAFEEAGNVANGEKVFASKNCTLCHGGRLANSGAPALESLKGPFNPVTMTSALWTHGPRMLETMKKENVRWPRFRDREMLDLLAFLNQKARQP